MKCKSLILFTLILVVLSDPLITSAGSLNWRRAVDDLTIFRSSWRRPELASPLLSEDKVYVASRRWKLAVFNKETGKRLSLINLDAGAVSTPVLDSDRIYIATRDGYFRCLDSETGKEIWKYKTGVLCISESVISENYGKSDGLVIFQTGRDVVVALNMNTGEWVWSYRHERREDLAIMGLSRPVVDDNVVYVGLSGGYVAALSIEDGKELWKTRAFESLKYTDIDANPSIDEDAVYVTSYSGQTAALSKRTGKVYWTYPAGGLAKPYLDQENVYIATMDEKVVAVDRMTGVKVWETQLQTHSLIKTENLPSIKMPKMKKNKKKRIQTEMAKRVKDQNWLLACEIIDNKIVTHDMMGNFFLLDKKDGSIKRTKKRAKHISAPMVINQKNAYFLSNKGYLYKISLE